MVVECKGLKPCCAGDSGMCDMILFRTILSSILGGYRVKKLVCKRLVL